MALPVQFLKEQAQQERGEAARMSSFVGAIAIGDLVKSTLGPKGLVRALTEQLLYLTFMKSSIMF